MYATRTPLKLEGTYIMTVVENITCTSPLFASKQKTVYHTSNGAADLVTSKTKHVGGVVVFEVAMTT